MTNCPACQKPIRGSYWGSVGISRYHPPAYCIHCGAAYPWTERKVQAAIELFADEVTPEEVAGFEKDVKAITQDTPAAQVASNRIVRALKKIGTGAAGAIRDILVDIASEAAKKTLFPNP